jgi:hypothetical protein
MVIRLIQICFLRRYEGLGPTDSSMGNSTSQALHRRTEDHSWTNSYPRDSRGVRSVKAPQNKVLPERIPGQRLRVTDNGAILHNGGTISGRRQTISIGENLREHGRQVHIGSESEGFRHALALCCPKASGMHWLCAVRKLQACTGSVLSEGFRHALALCCPKASGLHWLCAVRKLKACTGSVLSESLRHALALCCPKASGMHWLCAVRRLQVCTGSMLSESFGHVPALCCPKASGMHWLCVVRRLQARTGFMLSEVLLT